MPDTFLSRASIANLKRRARLLGMLRAFFDQRGFIEVQTPVLCRESVIDRHLDPIRVPMRLPGHEQETWFLQTSPEQSMKRLLASGIGSIYQIGPVFRDGELGPFHNPEFTMAEWYEVGATHLQGQRLLCELVEQLLETPPTEIITFEEAFRAGTGLDLFGSAQADFARVALEHGLVSSVAWSNDWDDWVNLLFSSCVQGHLGHGRPTLVSQFPASQAALAVVSTTDPRTAERYEIFYQGVELANGYHELLDANTLRERDEVANAGRVADGKDMMPACSKLLAAMERGIPGSCGCALGFDRLVMLACKVKTLEEVVAFLATHA
jgi:elongation factor P--(R)-beta-lysine ligase